jgi:hypothetical protein
VGKFVTLFLSISLLFEEAEGLLDEHWGIQNRLRSELAQRRGVQGLALLRGQEREPGVLGFDGLEQVMLIHRLKIGEH